MVGMPSRNTIKQYVEDGFYHVYNRGVERRRIFMDDQDYAAFLHLLKYFLSKPEEEAEHPLKKLNGFSPIRKRPLSTLHGKIELHSYCLMPNHFHLLIKQKEKNAMELLLRKVLTTYVMYFNRRYDRVGHLFQGTYKAVLINDENQLLHLSRYIHLNPSLTKKYLNQYPFSSYRNYIGERRNEWLNTDFILSFFQKPKSDGLGVTGFRNYKEFVEGYNQNPKEIIGKIALEED